MSKSRATRSPARKPLTRNAIVRAALGLAEADGLDHLTVRGVGAALNVSGMSLYAHVKNKNDLLHAMADAVLSDIAVPDTTSLSWDEGLRQIAESLRQGLLRYPHTAPLVLTRGPDALAATPLADAGVDLLVDAGFDEPTAVHGTLALTSFLVGTLLREGSIADNCTRTPSDEEPARVTKLQLDSDSEPFLVVDHKCEFHYGLELMITALRGAGGRA